MLSTPDIDPYAVLGVQKDATLAEIKSAHRKLVLKCHPDKVKDESQRSKAQEEFQQVQQAYELLSDETKRTRYDQKVRLAELRREMMAREGSAGGSYPYSSPRGSGTSREYRDGRYYEERKPADAAFFEDDYRYCEEPRPMSRKYDEFERRRPRTKTTEEKKKSKAVPLDHLRTAKDAPRDSVKSTHTTRAKYRTKERRREAYEKHERAGPYYDSEDDSEASDSSASSIYVKVKRPSESKRNRDSSSRKTKSTDSSRRAERARYDDEDNYSDAWDSKHEKLHTTAQDYILRSKAVPVESDRRRRLSRSPEHEKLHTTAQDYILRSKAVPVESDRRRRPSRSPVRHHGYESADPEPSSRRPGRSSRSSREDVRPSTSRNGSYEHLESQSRSYETKRPSMPTAATSPSIKVSSSTVRPSLQPSRSASSAQTHSRSRREPTSRVEQVLLNMVRQSVKPRGVERYDSGYSSPGTPEMAPGDSPTKTSTRYKIKEQDTVVVEPVMPPPPTSSSRHSRAYSPPRAERSSTSTRSAPKPVRSSTTYAYPPEPSSRHESTRPSASRQSSTRLFGEVEHSSHPKEKDIKYAREIRPEHIVYSTRDAYSRQHYDEYRQPPAPRRQSAYA
ncbi:dnaJ homolog subfamily C member 16 [Aspergillus udagawae]|uniref:DnaJ homolog subfamily C member 16 n=1 Tax=Aspergillus udagawae TaxID=91492 RepID=A0A8H3P7I4_9EURO|nr:uncharacterized protein Aud_010414 [Aspergillus udagawae]GFF44274.1 dnaJ homolog subfamily C member 16 [Aspergillus udagawae]GFF80226.1 dnaJ homolog subfamily C member 16 [Aspergillus udagawae]GFG21687.1 dnaJ homolog subfamily C member 16 [Aspergillus udagawae]GIC93926.1 hypothetical protein Aud_010414 [Aspergillus udagawae]